MLTFHPGIVPPLGLVIGIVSSLQSIQQSINEAHILSISCLCCVFLQVISLHRNKLQLSLISVI